MKISYLITLYNKENCIRDVLYSIKKQFGDFEKEIIIVEDESKDNSLNVAKETAKELNNLDIKIISQKNSGPSIAINTGLKLCTGKYIFLCDGDDYVYPDATISMVALAEKYGVKLVNAQHSNNFPYDKNHYDSKVEIINDSIERAIKFFPIASSLIDRELFIEIGGCDERVFVQDYSPALRASPYTSFVFINKLISHDLAKDTCSRLSSSKLLENRDTAKARYYFCLDHELTEAQKILALRVQLRKTFSWYRKNNFILKAIFSKYFVRLLLSKIYPKILLKNFNTIMKESLGVF